MNIPTPEEMSTEQAADLSALHAAAASQDENETAAPGHADVLPDIAGELSGLITIAVTTMKPMLPSLGEIYTPETVTAASSVIAGVCNKHGWLQGGLMGGYGEEIAAAAVLIPLAIATNQGVRADIARAKAKSEKAAAVTAGQVPENGQQQPGPDTKTVFFGNEVSAGVQ